MYRGYGCVRGRAGRAGSWRPGLDAATGAVGGKGEARVGQPRRTLWTNFLLRAPNGKELAFLCLATTSSPPEALNLSLPPSFLPLSPQRQGATTGSQAT